jgi:hypothetical protein
MISKQLRFRYDIGGNTNRCIYFRDTTPWLIIWSRRQFRAEMVHAVDVCLQMGPFSINTQISMATSNTACLTLTILGQLSAASLQVFTLLDQ